MKRFNLNRVVVAIAMMLIGWLPSLAHDFEVDGIFYNKTDGNTVSVAYKGNGVNDYENEYSGAVNIPSSVTYNGTTYTVTSIAQNALKYCSNVTSVSIPNTVTLIDDASVAHTSITTITIPSSVTYVGENAFNSCKLKTVNVGGGAIGEQAFANNSNLTELTLGEKVTYIESWAFYNCKKLTKITCLATTPPTISKSDAFSNYSANLYVPKFRKSTYQSADHWKNFNIYEILNVGDKFSVNGLNYIITVKEQEVAVDKWYSNYYSGDIVIPSSVEYNGVAYSVTSIEKWAFNDCTGLTSVVIPNSIASIGEEAFMGCTSLTSVVIPNSITSIGAEVFKGCSNLVSVEIPNTVTSIGDYAFVNCSSLTSITIPDSVASIGKSAFYGCKNLSKITCLATTPPTITSSTFSNYSVDLYVPKSSISAYQSANYWKNFNIKEMPTISTSIVLNKTSASLKATETLTLVATVLPENATNKSVTWKSSNEAVAIVDANGKVTAVAVGEATITATTADGSNKSATCKITVAKTLASSISLDKTSATLKATETLTLKATVTPTTTTDKSVTWKSSNTSVATVDANGKVTAVAVGEATISATTADGSNKSATCKITVAKTLASSISLDKTSATLKATETLTLKATVAPATTTDKSVTWTSSNVAVATVDANGKVTAVAVGEATITATTADGSNKSATCKITVAKTLASSISLDKTSATLKATETLTLKATVAPATTTNKSVTWKSSNEAVATVDANGKVTAVAVGEATITATTADGSNKSATCKITVAKTLATSISLDKTSATLKATETLTLKATVAPTTTTDKSVTWTSSNTSVATVDANGKVTAVAVGETTITATTADGSNKSATCKITVAKTLAESVTLNKTSATLKATETLTLKATVAPATTTDKSVTWTSSNEAVVTVDANGKVIAVAVGEATITATTADGSNLSASCKVTVIPTLAESITLDKIEISLEATKTATLIATILPELTTDKSVEWSSSNEAIAVVDENGVVTAIAIGEATITATTTDGTNLSASCVVNVIPTLANSIVLDITEVSLKATQTVVLTPMILPATTTDANVTWMSSDESVAVVDEDGLVTAIGVGIAIITATTADGSNLSATCVVTVVPTPGDVNNDASVNVTDIVTVASYIVGKTTDVFIFEAADMTKDGKINVTDIVGIASIILNGGNASNVSAQRCAPNSSDVIKIEDFAAGKNQSQQVAIEMTNASDYSACQMDIRLPKGMSIAECELASAATDHMVAYRELPDGAVRVLVYSLTCRTLPDSEEGIISLRTTTDNRFEGGEIVVENILFADRGQNEYRLYDSVANVNLATGVSATDMDCVVYAENQSIVIISPCDQQVTISSVGGVSRTYTLNEGRNEIAATQAGIYIVTLADKTFKVMVK